MSRNARRQMELAHYKERLVARAEAQRAAIVENVRSLRGPIGVVDHGLEVVRFLRAYPLIVIAAVAALTVFRRRGLLSLAGRALAAWRLWRSVSTWLAGRSA